MSSILNTPLNTKHFIAVIIVWCLTCSPAYKKSYFADYEYKVIAFLQW